MSRAAVRLAGSGDAGEVAGLIAAFRDHYGDSEPTDEAILASVRRLLVDEETEFLLAGEPPIGVAQLRFRHSVWTGIDDAWLEDIFVREEARRSGAGQALATACVERARLRGCRRIQLDMVEGNEAALALYESVGFALSRRGSESERDLCLTMWL